MKFETIVSHSIYVPPLSSDSVVLDLGANRGEFSKQMSARFGGKYFLVEANPQLAEQLLAEDRFPVWHCAVAAEEGEVEFHIAHDDRGSSLLEFPSPSTVDDRWNECQRARNSSFPERPSPAILRETVVIRARRLESLIAEMGLEQIDLVKMDIEAAEVSVLRALPDSTLSAIGQLTVEFHSDPWFGFDIHREAEDVIRRLRGLGFVCLDFSHLTLVTSRSDVLFLNRRLLGIPRLQGLYWETVTSPPQVVTRIWRSLPSTWKTSLRGALDWALRS
jgi:FkbM family methyltransferase